jgi:hypothetical protein
MLFKFEGMVFFAGMTRRWSSLGAVVAAIVMVVTMVGCARPTVCGMLWARLRGIWQFDDRVSVEMKGRVQGGGVKSRPR